MDELARTLLVDSLNSIPKKNLIAFSREELGFEGEINIEKEDLVSWIVSEVAKDALKLEDLIVFINEVQEWGKQHIFLYRSDPKHRARVKKITLQNLEEIIAANDFDIDINDSKSIFMPEETGFELYKVHFEEGKRLCLCWAEKRKIFTRLQEDDYTENGVEYRAWKSHVARGLLVFDWSLSSGQMMIRVSQADNQVTYNNAKKIALETIETLFGIEMDSWKQLDIRRSIARIKDSGKVSTKKYNQESGSGGKQSLQARDKRHGIENDTELTAASKVIRGRFASTYGNYYWNKVDPFIKKEVHTSIDSKSKSFLVFGIHPEDVIRYVIDQIIHYTTN